MAFALVTLALLALGPMIFVPFHTKKLLNLDIVSSVAFEQLVVGIIVTALTV
jgi:hypothetical protein